MKTKIIVSSIAAVLLFSVLLGAHQPTAQRLVRMSIEVNGQKTMFASTSDNGHPDADAVWNYLSETNFEFEEGQLPDNIDEDADEFTLTGDREKGLIKIDVRYGGKATVRELRFTRVEADHAGRVWRIDPAVITEQFANRSISRRQAANLQDSRLPE